MTWKHIPFLPERFEASADGLIRTRSYEIEVKGAKRQLAGRVLSQRFERVAVGCDKHMRVSISRGGTRTKENRTSYRVAYLVAAAFHGLPFDRHDIADVHRWKLRFIDGDVQNCTPTNLEWVRNCMDTGDGQQLRYERNLDDWKASDPAATLARLFEDAA